VFKKITVFLFITLFAGLYFSPVQANSKLQRILQITNFPVEINGLEARLDRDLLVYGLPTDTPNNQWKPAPTSWEKDNQNKYNFGHPGNEEPRYLGKTIDWSNFANDYFPDDAEYHISPSKRNMIELPWHYDYEQSGNRDISDYSWGLIKEALSTYNQRIGFNDNKDGFANNPAFYSDFDNVKKYFKVLAEPRPGMAGAVRHWHKREDLGGVWYDPIFIRWDILPNFIVEKIDPGTDRAKPGETYSGKVVLKAKPDGSFLSDPVTGQLFNSMGLKLELSQDYTVPFGVVLNGQFLPIKNFQPVSGMENIYQYKIPAGTTENTLEFTFDWTAPANISSDKITLATGVNESITVLPKDVWGYVEWSEITSIDNVKAVEVAIEQPLRHDIKVEVRPEKNSYTALNGGITGVNFIILVTRKDDIPEEINASGYIDGLAGRFPINTILGPGDYKETKYGFPASPGSYTVEAEAWPLGSEDAAPEDNRDSATVTVENQVFKPDSKIRVDLIDGGPIYR